jgi:hypothetical protein
LAANGGIGNDIKTFAESILRKLEELESKPQNIVREDIFHLAVEKYTPQILFYKRELCKYARNCRMQLSQEMRDEMGVIILVFGETAANSS